MLEIEIVQGLNNYLDSNGIKFSNELRMGIGIPDISFNIGANYRLKPIEDYFLLAILTFIEKHKAVTFEEIKIEYSLSIDKVKKYVYQLAKMSFVKVNKQLIKVIKSIFSTNLGTTISIEAKLKDWKGACLQAQRYLYFSDYAYVALPKKNIKNVDYDYFIKKGIGLLSVEKNKVEEIIPGKKSELCEYTQKYLVTSKIVEKYYHIEKKHTRKNIFTPYLSVV